MALRTPVPKYFLLQQAAAAVNINAAKTERGSVSDKLFPLLWDDKSCRMHDFYL